MLLPSPWLASDGASVVYVIVVSHSCCEFLLAMAVPSPEDNILQAAFFFSRSCHLTILPSVRIPKPLVDYKHGLLNLVYVVLGLEQR